MKLARCDRALVQETIANSPEGRNTRFLSASDSLWFRFNNYAEQGPFVLTDGADPVAFVFATMSKRSRYMNLYDIVTVQGMEGNGYASEIFELVMEDAYYRGMQRLKMSCTPSSVTWHARNGLLFWAVDPTGSLRSDQPIFPNQHEQLTFRELALKDPSFAIPPDRKVVEQLKRESLESHGFGKKKTEKVETAIQDVGEYWLRDALMQTEESSLEEFM